MCLWAYLFQARLSSADKQKGKGMMQWPVLDWDHELELTWNKLTFILQETCPPSAFRLRSQKALHSSTWNMMWRTSPSTNKWKRRGLHDVFALTYVLISRPNSKDDHEYARMTLVSKCFSHGTFGRKATNKATSDSGHGARFQNLATRSLSTCDLLKFFRYRLESISNAWVELAFLRVSLHMQIVTVFFLVVHQEVVDFYKKTQEAFGSKAEFAGEIRSILPDPNLKGSSDCEWAASDQGHHVQKLA